MEKSNLNKVIYISICFMTMSIGVTPSQTLSSQLYAQLGFHNLGIISLFVIFMMRGIFSVISPYVMSKVSIRIGIACGGMTQIMRITGGALVALCNKYEVDSGVCHSGSLVFINVLCAAVGGIGAAFLFYSQASYVNECADGKNKGFFNGIFWSVSQSAHLWGSALAAFILGRADHLTFYITMTAFGLFGAFKMLFIKDPETPEVKTKVQSQESLSQAIQSFMRIFDEKHYYFLFASLVFSGIAIGSYITFLSAAATDVVNSDDLFYTNQRTGYVFMSLAVGTILAGILSGRVADRFDKIKVYTATMILNEAALVLTVLACMFRSFSLIVFAGFLWGLGESAIQTLIGAVIGSVFQGEKNLFSAHRSLQAFGIVYAALLSIIIPRSQPILYYIVVFISLGICHYLFQSYLEKFGRKSNSLLSNEKRKFELSERMMHKV